MFNYIRSEFYRNIHVKGSTIILIVTIGFVLLSNIFLSSYGGYGNTKTVFAEFGRSMGIPMILCLPLVSIINGNEFKNRTLKNSISYGISRSQIYLGKFIVEVSISIIILICITAVYIISGYILLENSGIMYLNDLLTAIVACVPLFIVGIACAHCLYFTCDNGTVVGLVWIAIMVVIPQGLSIVGSKFDIVKKISDYIPWNMFDVQ
ncbi:MAG: ABC transporter permease, partial [Paraclostridium sp.]